MAIYLFRQDYYCRDGQPRRLRSRERTDIEWSNQFQYPSNARGNFCRVHAALAMAASVVSKPLGIFLPTHSGTLSIRQRIENRDSQSQGRPIKASFKSFRHNRVSTRRVCVRALIQGDGGKRKCNKEGGVEDANTDTPEISELICEGSPDRTDLSRELQQQLSAGKENPEPCRGSLHGLANKLGPHKSTTTSWDEDTQMQQRQQQPNQSKQHDARCKLRSLWRTALRPQNLLAAFLTGLLLYAIALFGWQVMVVAVDVTLFVLKCSFVALVLLVAYIFLLWSIETHNSREKREQEHKIEREYHWLRSLSCISLLGWLQKKKLVGNAKTLGRRTDGTANHWNFLPTFETCRSLSDTPLDLIGVWCQSRNLSHWKSWNRCTHKLRNIMLYRTLVKGITPDWKSLSTWPYMHIKHREGIPIVLNQNI